MVHSEVPHTHIHTHRASEITWTNNFNISEITNPYKVTWPHLCLQWKVSGRWVTVIWNGEGWSAAPPPPRWGDRTSFYGDNCGLMEQLSNTGLNDDFKLLSRAAQSHSRISQLSWRQQSFFFNTYCLLLAACLSPHTPLTPNPERVTKTASYLQLLMGNSSSLSNNIPGDTHAGCCAALLIIIKDSGSVGRR